MECCWNKPKMSYECVLGSLQLMIVITAGVIISSSWAYSVALQSFYLIWVNSFQFDPRIFQKLSLFSTPYSNVDSHLFKRWQRESECPPPISNPSTYKLICSYSPLHILSRQITPVLPSTPLLLTFPATFTIPSLSTDSFLSIYKYTKISLKTNTTQPFLDLCCYHSVFYLNFSEG